MRDAIVTEQMLLDPELGLLLAMVEDARRTWDRVREEGDEAVAQLCYQQFLGLRGQLREVLQRQGLSLPEQWLEPAEKRALTALGHRRVG